MTTPTKDASPEAPGATDATATPARQPAQSPAAQPVEEPAAAENEASQKARFRDRLKAKLLTIKDKVLGLVHTAKAKSDMKSIDRELQQLTEQNPTSPDAIPRTAP